MRWIVGLLLTAAALMKGLGLFQHPAVAHIDSYSRLLLPLLIDSEFGLGLLALAGVYWRRFRVVAVLLFAAFACYSFWLAMQGAESCGCFGELEVHPWWTVFSMCLCLPDFYESTLQTTWKRGRLKIHLVFRPIWASHYSPVCC